HGPLAPDAQLESVAVAPERGRHQTTGLHRRQSGLEAGMRCCTQRARARGRAQPPPLYHRTMSTPSFEIPPPPPAAPAMGFIDTWRRVMSDPRSFFADMAQAGGLQEPLAFLAVCAAVDAVGTLLMGWGIRGMIGTFVTVVAGGGAGGPPPPPGGAGPRRGPPRVRPPLPPLPPSGG